MLFVNGLYYYLPTELGSDVGNKELCVDCVLVPDVTCFVIWAKTTAFHGTPAEEGPRMVISTESSKKENLFFLTSSPSFQRNLYIKTHSLTILFIHSFQTLHPTFTQPASIS